MRIAVCFNGQLRTGISASKNLLRFFGDLIQDIDVFVHTWDINTYRSPLNLAMLPPPAIKVTDEEISSFTDIYNPKHIIVENQSQFWHQINQDYGMNQTGDLIHIWHSGYTSNFLKIQEEISTNLKYDIVVRIRPDCIFPIDRYLEQDIEDILNNPDTLYYNNLFGDVYQIGTSKIMDAAFNSYRDKKFHGSGDWPMTIFLNYLSYNNIKYEVMKDNRVTILRSEFNYMDPNNYYYHYNAINTLIYENINYGNNTITETYRNEKNPNWFAECFENLKNIFGDENTVREYFNSFKSL